MKDYIDLTHLPAEKIEEMTADLVRNDFRRLEEFYNTQGFLYGNPVEEVVNVSSGKLLFDKNKLDKFIREHRLVDFIKLIYLYKFKLSLKADVSSVVELSNYTVQNVAELKELIDDLSAGALSALTFTTKAVSDVSADTMSIAAALADNVNEINEKFTNYYTADKIDGLNRSLDVKIDNVAEDLAENYLNSTQIEENYYEKATVDTLLKHYSTLSDNIVLSVALDTRISANSKGLLKLWDKFDDFKDKSKECATDLVDYASKHCHYPTTETLNIKTLESDFYGFMDKIRKTDNFTLAAERSVINGTFNYDELQNMPNINGKTLKGNVTDTDLSISYDSLTHKPDITGMIQEKIDDVNAELERKETKIKKLQTFQTTSESCANKLVDYVSRNCHYSTPETPVQDIKTIEHDLYGFFDIVRHTGDFALASEKAIINGTLNYSELENKPVLNGKPLSGNVEISYNDLADKSDIQTIKEQLNTLSDDGYLSANLICTPGQIAKRLDKIMNILRSINDAL